MRLPTQEYTPAQHGLQLGVTETSLPLSARPVAVIHNMGAPSLLYLAPSAPEPLMPVTIIVAPLGQGVRLPREAQFLGQFDLWTPIGLVLAWFVPGWLEHP